MKQYILNKQKLIIEKKILKKLPYKTWLYFIHKY